MMGSPHTLTDIGNYYLRIIAQTRVIDYDLNNDYI